MSCVVGGAGVPPLVTVDRRGEKCRQSEVSPVVEVKSGCGEWLRYIQI